MRRTPVVEAGGPPATTSRHLVLLTGVAVVAVLLFAVGLLLPYYVNGLHRLPLSELGSHEPEDLWPAGTGWSRWVGVAVLLSFTVALPMLIVTTGLAGWAAVRAGRAGRGIAVGFAVMSLACGAVLAWLAGPTGSALVAWRMD